MHKGDCMKIIFVVLMTLCLSVAVASAADFDWMRDMNIRAEADPSGFRAQISTRFSIGDAEVRAIISNVERPSDAYMVFRLGQMANRPPEYVLSRYKSGRGKGWGVLAKSLGIKPGSREFHALKRGHDLYDYDGKNKGKGKGKGKWKNKD